MTMLQAQVDEILIYILKILTFHPTTFGHPEASMIEKNMWHPSCQLES